jgi:hypothetical protein
MGKYILNQETQKIELHFSKPEYQALSENQKKEIKSNFLFSGKVGAWVSRSTNNHYWAIETAKKIGLEDGGKTGERLSYAEELDRKADRAEARAERMETHAENAEKRAENLQKEFNSYHGDISFFTQPNINSSRGRAFTNYRNRVYARYESGMQEYRKSEYFQGKAETARATADMSQLKDPIYLHNRIKECNSAIKKLQQNIISYEEKIERIEKGETITSYSTSEPLTVEQYAGWINETLEKMEYELDKLAFMENNLEEIGGNKFSKENVKPGYIVKVRRWGNVLVTATGPVNFGYKMIRETGNLKDWPGQDPYEAIIEIVEAKEKETTKLENPFRVGDILCKHYGVDTRNAVYKAYQVIKTTEAGIKIQPIEVEKGVPVPDKFIGEPMQKKLTKSRWSEFVGVYDDNWQLHKYNPEAKAV